MPYRRAGGPISGLCLAVVALLSLASPVTGQESPNMLLEATTQRTLVRLQEDWLRWLSASYRESPESSSTIIDSLIATGEQLEFRRFPDLCFGALQQAVRAAREGEVERAEWILRAAERLDAGRPETRFAEAFIAKEGGSWPRALVSELAGYWRLSRLPRERELWLANVVLWTLWVLLIAAGAFVVVAFVAHGPQLYQDLAALISGPFPVLALPVVVPLLLLSPLVFSAGLFWLLSFWSVLLWAYCSSTERAVLICGWLLAAVTPVLVIGQRESIQLASSPAARPLTALTEGRLYGDLFRDLATLREGLPNDPAVLQLEADLHQRIGQVQTARALYRRVLEMEPENPGVLTNIGVQYFRRGDFGNAITYFQRAASADSSRAEPAFNLSQAYSQSFAFEESQRALEDAKSRDNEAVAGWIESSIATILIQGGVDRIPEIRERLVESLPRNEGAPARLALGLLVALGVLGVSIGWAGLRQRVLPGPRFGQSVPTANRWLLALVPGAEAADIGAGFRSFFAVLLPAVFLLLPASRAVGCRLPWGFEPPGVTALAVAVVGIVAVVAWKARTILKEGV